MNGIQHTTVLTPELGPLSGVTSTALFAGIVVTVIVIAMLVLIVAILSGCLIYTKSRVAQYKGKLNIVTGMHYSLQV